MHNAVKYYKGHNYVMQKLQHYFYHTYDMYKT